MKRIKWNTLLQVLILVLAAVCVLSALLRDNQAKLSIPLKQQFVGSYSQDGGPWQELTEESDISALDGDLVLRGHFATEIPDGARLNFYLNHLGASISVNGTPIYMSTVLYYAENQLPLTPSVCGKWWDCVVTSGVQTTDEVEIHLHNPHKHGNKTAFRDFLNTLCNSPNTSDVLEKSLEPYSNPFRVVGWCILVVAVMLAGAAVVAVVLQIRISGMLWRFGLLAASAGGFFLLDTLDFSFLKGLLVFNTYGRQICIMLFVLWLGFCVVSIMPPHLRRLTWAVTVAAAVEDCILLLLSLIGVVVIYDTVFYWAVAQLLVCPVLLVSCGLALYRGKKENRVLLVAYMLLLISVMLDILGVGASLISRGTCTKVVFTVLFVFLIVHTVIGVVRNHQAAEYAQVLEKKLEDSRIATMLSQIQPHFIYNTLGTVEQLCKEQPEVAASLVHDFSLYLRGNFSELDNSAPIRLSKEMEHVRHYVNIEHIRFPDMEIRFDLRAEDFLLPALSVQPLVENAIKHGLMGLESGGTVTISTYETADHYCVSVIDNGVGFDTALLQDEQKHIGIRNIRGRLKAMCGGTLTVESKPGAGTKALILIPKEDKA